jgi:hypothetical protein
MEMDNCLQRLKWEEEDDGTGLHIVVPSAQEAGIQNAGTQYHHGVGVGSGNAKANHGWMGGKHFENLKESSK